MPDAGGTAPGVVDVHTYIGSFAFREVPHPDPDVLVRVLEREHMSGAWVGYLPAAHHRDPAPGNEALLSALERYPQLLATPVIRPDWPRWELALGKVIGKRVAAIRAHPPQWRMAPGDSRLNALAGACGESGVPLLLTVRFEDSRQRHELDTAGDLSPAAIRAVARAGTRAQLVIAGAGRATIEEVHWGLTPEEREYVWWDISWIWGPPEDDLAHLFRTIGASRFVYGSGWPLRLTQTPRANLELLPDDQRSAALATAGQIAEAARAVAR